MVFLQQCFSEAEVTREDLNYILGISTLTLVYFLDTITDD